MRNLGLILLAVALLLGGVAAWGVRSINASRAPAKEGAGQTTVIVASRSIGFGEPLTAEVLRVQAWPQGAQPQGSFKTVSELTGGAKRLALAPIAPNEPVLATRISGPGGRATLSGVIRAGMRATTIRVNDVFGVAGFVLPGDFVDVLVTRDQSGAPGGDRDMSTDVLLRSVRVLAVDQLANDNKNDPVVAKAATIEVTPEQAQKLALASQVGTLSLALRGTVDPISPKDEAAAPTVRITDLRMDGAPKAPTPRAVPVTRRRTHPRPPAEAKVEIIRGLQATSVGVPAGGVAG